MKTDTAWFFSLSRTFLSPVGSVSLALGPHPDIARQSHVLGLPRPELEECLLLTQAVVVFRYSKRKLMAVLVLSLFTKTFTALLRTSPTSHLGEFPGCMEMALPFLLWGLRVLTSFLTLLIMTNQAICLFISVS